MSEPERDFSAIAEQIRQAREAYRAEWVELLEQAEKAHRDASAHADKYRRLRNDTIRTAVMSGLSQSDISPFLGRLSTWPRMAPSRVPARPGTRGNALAASRASPG